jgi:NAD(P)-dependent dehydrogenase (short-subunit alcohol dehydrogenase family)
MPPHAQIHTTISTLPTGPRLVITIIGGTSGIGSYIAKAFASVYRSSGSKLRVYIVGRNASRAEALLTDVRSTSPGSEWRFVKAHDLALMSDVDAVCAQIKQYEEKEPLKEGSGGPSIDMLYMCQAISPLAPSNREFSSSSSVLSDGGVRYSTW